MKPTKLVLLVLASLLSFEAFAKPKKTVQPEQPKYVFYFILDGTGVNTVLGTEVMLSELKGELGRTSLWMTQTPVVGLSTTYSTSSDVTDSAASGTALATGVKTYNGAIGMYPDKKTPAISIAQRAHDKGFVVGVGSSCPVNHATPAAQYGHVVDRNQYYDIAVQMIETNFEFLGGGSINIERGHSSNALDSIYSALKEKGYSLCFSVEDYEKAVATAQKVVMLQGEVPDPYSLPYWIDRKPGQVTIVDQFRAELDMLYRKSQEKKTGFYCFNEVGGKVDFACHAHDAAAAYQEVLASDSCVRVALDFYEQHPTETLIVITSDHETGGLSLGRDGIYQTNFKNLQYQHCSIDEANRNMLKLTADKGGFQNLSWEDVKAQIANDFGLWSQIKVSEQEEEMLKGLFDKTVSGEASDTRTLYASSKAFMTAALELVQKKAMVGWTTGGHTGGLVPVYAIGVGCEQFTGLNDNASIPMTIAKIAGY